MSIDVWKKNAHKFVDNDNHIFSRISIARQNCENENEMDANSSKKNTLLNMSGFELLTFVLLLFSCCFYKSHHERVQQIKYHHKFSVQNV